MAPVGGLASTHGRPSRRTRFGCRVEPAGDHRRGRRAAADGRDRGRRLRPARRRRPRSRAERAGIPAIAVPAVGHEPRGDYDARLADIVAAHGPELVVLAGWMRILTMAFLGWFPDAVINLHPALPGELPGHPRHRAGAGTRPCAGERTRTGVMVHRVPDEGVDDGPVLGHGRRADPARRHPRRRSPPASTPPSTPCSSTRSPRLVPDRRSDMTTAHNDALFDRFEALTFDDVVDRAGLLRDAARRRRHLGHVRRRHHAGGPARLGGDGQGHRGAHGDRHGPPRRHRRDPPQPVDRRPGGRGAEGQAQPERDDHRSRSRCRRRRCCTRPRS